ncbi:DMT family transporter [Staphylococcus sp. 18_1_E_LY]|uniref:DMT family transporter n=1 Tax=Staphylococcus lloydii TaxID=2781774 RepID=A0A7T1B043_9STAP|nr:DMT family transporter [Staphylococcus lloydii]MBF7019946.1 DMT family transporter [Staphylococcus lloydii]MBF7027629.1 DMT family transporter [Staphylococcus lloydii]QPM75314.1 DMT family transporter [Staphylococcus lloydii]
MLNIKINKSILLAFGVTIFLWASAFPVIKLALQDFKAENLSALRLIIGSLLLCIIGIIKKVPLPLLKDIPFILLLGFCGFTVYHTSLSIGEYYVSAGIASLLVTTTPIFSALLAIFFLREKFSKLAWMGSIIAFLGVALISLGSEGNITVVVIGVILILFASLGESIYFVFQKRYLDKYGFIPFTIYTIVSGAIFMLLFLPGSYNEVQTASTTSLLAVLYLGIFPTVIPYFALAFTIQKIGVSDATISLYLTPLVSILLSYLLLGEIPTLIVIGGGIITLIGVSIVVISVDNH